VRSSSCTTRAPLRQTGALFDSPVIGLYEVRDGKFARPQMFHFDTQAINEFVKRAREAKASAAA
jgi:ketosteroid isomerase-like protein